MYTSYRKSLKERKASIEQHWTNVYGEDWKDQGKLLDLLNRVMPMIQQKEFILTLAFKDIDRSSELTKREKFWLKASYALFHPYDNLEAYGKDEYQQIL